MSILFVNGSFNKVGNTAILAEKFLRGKEYKKDADLMAERLG